MSKPEKYKILHIFNDPKFSQGFFNFLIKHGVELQDNFLFHFRLNKSTGKTYGMPAIFSPGFFSPVPNLLMLNPLFRSEKIVIHSLAAPFLLIYLCIFPVLGKKSYWVIWGKDLYFFKTLRRKHVHHYIYEFFRKKAIKNIAHIITYNEGDYLLAKKWYGSNAVLHKSFMYPSNLFNDYPVAEKKSARTVILVGNSADPSNNHHEVFRILEKFKDEDIEIIVPLTYGQTAYTADVIKTGTSIFAGKFKPITEFVPYEDYINLLSQVDIGLFAHKRQQAMGNITTLLGMQKKVCMRKDITTWSLLQGLGVKVFDVTDFDLAEIDNESSSKNRQIIKSVFCEDKLLEQWRGIANDEPG